MSPAPSSAEMVLMSSPVGLKEVEAAMCLSKSVTLSNASSAVSCVRSLGQRESYLVASMARAQR